MPTDLFSIAQRVALVTGAARGLGRELATGLARQGARVVLGDLNEQGAAEAAEGIRSAGGDAFAARLDVTGAASCDAFVRSAVERYGRIDVLVNNAGIDIVEPAGEVSAEAWAKILDVDLKGVLNASQSAIRRMREQGGGGSIVNISSIAGVVAIPGLTAYSAAKGGVLLLTRVMALELAPQNIRVNAIAPGYLENVMANMTTEHARPETEQRIRTRTPMGRRAKLAELVGPVVFLASGAASYVTGAVLAVDGGYTAA